MNLKIKKNKLILYLILLSIIFENQLFHIIKIDNIIFKIITMIFIFISFSLVNYKKKLIYISFVIIFIFVFQFIYSIFILKKPIYGFLAESFHFLLVFAIPSFIHIFQNKKLNVLFWKSMKIIIFIQYLISIIAITILEIKGINITNRNFSYRSFGSISVSIYTDSIFIPLVMIFSFYQILKKNERLKWSDFLIVIFGLLHSIVITKSRAITISFLLSAFIMFILSKGKNILKISIITICICFLMKYGLLNKIFHLKEGNFASSNQGHLKAIQECWNYFLDHPLLGAGVNLDWPVSYCDAGFIGLLANIGIGAFIIYILPLLKFTLVTIKQKFLLSENFTILSFGYISFTVLTSVTLIMTDDVRMYGFIFILSIFYVLANSKKFY